MSKQVKQKISIYDVAKEAGVSISTVSRVFNRRDRVAPDTRKAVEKAIRRLEFLPNTQARALSRKRTDTIGLILPGFRGDYFGRLMEGVDEEARHADLQMTVSKATGPDAKIKTIKRILNEGRVDGLILMLDEMKGEVLDQLHDSDTPVVILDKDVEHRHLDNILLDNRTGARDATLHLIQVHGLTNMLFVGGPKENIDSCDRTAGFHDALMVAGIESHSKNYYNTNYEYDAGFSLGQRLAPRLKKEKKWGILAANDDLAQGIIAALLRKGLRVPENIAVIGFDDSHLARTSRPQLTSVRIPFKQIGHTAVKMILERLSNPQKEPSTVILKGQLIVRESCGCNQDRNKS